MPSLPGARLRHSIAALIVSAAPLAGQTNPDSSGTSSVFSRYADRVVKIEVVETGSSAKSELGSGFFVSDKGHVITNYHVISNIVNHPDRYRGEMLDRGGTTVPITVLAVDVIHDVAVIGTATKPAHHFALPPTNPRINQGTRLFALGHPRDLGLSIVEGTYNGLLQHTLYPKLHFTGSINPGMSGGPTISEAGEVVGINVRTAGNQLSFLVPVERARMLLGSVLAPGFQPPKDFLVNVAEQLRESQATYTADMFMPGSKTVRLGKFTLPTQPAPFFRCWGDATRRKEDPFATVEHQCSTEDYVYISGDQSSGLVEIAHSFVSSTELNVLRFFSLFEDRLGRGKDDMEGDEEDFTSFKCTTANVRNDKTTMRTVLCLRRYKRLTGLYDAVLKVAVLGSGNAGAISTLTLTGVTYETTQRLSKRYLERITWRG